MNRPDRTSPPSLIARAVTLRRAWLAAALIAVALAFALPAAAQDSPHFITLNYWPLDAPHWYVIDYPDTEWTWNFLGLNPGKTCPPYLIHDRAESTAYWRDPSTPEATDWEQASHGNRWVSCYKGHAGTDIVAPAYSPVYAVAAGEVIGIQPGRDANGPNAVVTVQHHRDIAGYSADWIVRYIHLENNFPVLAGPVKEGQVIGFVGERGTNTHLHFEIDDLWDCKTPCIVNPWGPISLFFDDDHDHNPDPASSILEAAPPGIDLVRNGDFAQGWEGWMALSGSGEAIRDGGLYLALLKKAERAAGVQQILPYSLPAGTGFEVAVTLGNAGSAARSVWVSLRDVRGFERSTGCAFSLLPGQSSVVVRVRGVARAQWANLVLLVSAGPADGGAAVVVRQISVRAVEITGRPGCIGGR